MRRETSFRVSKRMLVEAQRAKVGDRIEACDRPALITDLRLRVEVAHLRPRFDLHVVRR